MVGQRISMGLGLVHDDQSVPGAAVRGIAALDAGCRRPETILHSQANLFLQRSQAEAAPVPLLYPPGRCRL